MVLIAVVSLSERSREATLMSVRGLSYRQLVWMFLAENIAVITFSVILGIVVGYIIDYGTITASKRWNAISLVYPHVVYSQQCNNNNSRVHGFDLRFNNCGNTGNVKTIRN